MSGKCDGFWGRDLAYMPNDDSTKAKMNILFAYQDDGFDAVEADGLMGLSNEL
jgi:hypothetical protein